MQFREVRAHYDDAGITVYQAYRAEIAEAALSAGRFVPPFKRERSLQVGLGGPAVDLYVDAWVRGISDVTGLAREIRGRLDDNDEAGAGALLPDERVYPLPEAIGRRVGASPQERLS